MLAEAGYRAPEGPYETIGGLVLRELGHIPVAGEKVKLPALDVDSQPDESVRWQATVVHMDGHRIDVVELAELGSQPASQAADAESGSGQGA